MIGSRDCAWIAAGMLAMLAITTTLTSVASFANHDPAPEPSAATITCEQVATRLNTAQTRLDRLYQAGLFIAAVVDDTEVRDPATLHTLTQTAAPIRTQALCSVTGRPGDGYKRTATDSNTRTLDETEQRIATIRQQDCQALQSITDHTRADSIDRLHRIGCTQPSGNTPPAKDTP